MNKKCQVFTPADYVEELLDSVGYIEDLYGKKILENSCGDGNILVAIVKRYIADCSERGFSVSKIKSGLEKDIYGVEIDPEQTKNCVDNLNKILQLNNIAMVDWQIKNEDYLRVKDIIKYQFIIGNPPYITYKEMEKEDQIYLKNNFKSCAKGKFDYCYAFIEKSIESLDINGKMAYLIPSSIFKTVFGTNLRAYMKPYIRSIRDFTQEKMFNNALVKSAIMVLEANEGDQILHYTDVTLEKELNLPISILKEKWFFSKKSECGEKRFGDYFKVSHAVATLFNRAYVLKKGIETNGYFSYNNRFIEGAVIRETAAPRALRYGHGEKIIFPYYYENNQLKKYEEEEFEKLFPYATQYLNEFRENLNRRNSDNKIKWFEYGRSQALAGLNREKLLISTVITSEVVVYRLSKECIPYAGMYIVLKDDICELTLEEALYILKSRSFMQYVLDVGIHISGNSLRITSKDIEDYRF